MGCRGGPLAWSCRGVHCDTPSPLHRGGGSHRAPVWHLPPIFGLYDGHLSSCLHTRGLRRPRELQGRAVWRCIMRGGTRISLPHRLPCRMSSTAWYPKRYHPCALSRPEGLYIWPMHWAKACTRGCGVGAGATLDSANMLIFLTNFPNSKHHRSPPAPYNGARAFWNAADISNEHSLQAAGVARRGGRREGARRESTLKK